MFHYTAVEWLAFFYFYCFFGWCFESTFVSIKKRKFVNRGFIRGPFLPLYGTGAIMMLVVSAPFTNHLFLTFLAGCLGATVLEYFTGVAMEGLFKVRYWDYSNQKFNFQGQICLSSTLAWGVLTIFVTSFLHRYVEKIIFLIPGTILNVCVIVLTIFITIDFVLSFKAALELRDILIKSEQLKQDVSKEIELLQKRIDVVIAILEDATSEKKDELTKKLAEKYEKWAFYSKTGKLHIYELIRQFYRRSMLRDNPAINSKLFKENLDSLKDIIARGRRRKDTVVTENKNEGSTNTEEMK